MNNASLTALDGTPVRTDAPPGPRLHRALRPLMTLRHDRITPVLWAFETFGSVVMFRVINKRLYFINEPQAIQDLLVTHHRDTKKDSGHQLFLKPILGNGLLVSEGEFHLRQRRMLQPAFHRERIAAYAETMTAYAKRSADAWTPGQQVDVMREMMKLALGIVGKTLFNSDVDGEAKRVAAAIEDIMPMDAWMLHPFYWVLMRLPLRPVRRFRKALRALDETVARIIAAQRRGEDTGDVLSLMLAARDIDDGAAMTSQQLRDEVLTLFLAGHETTANTLTFAWHLLGTNPQVEARFHEELDTVLGGRAPRLEDLPKLDYTRRVFAETLRLYPAAYLFGRTTLREIQLAGYRIPRGSEVLVSPYATHRDPRWWDQPEQFDPDRFLPENAEGRPKFAYLPFGAGIRKCIGEQFAWMEGVLALATVGRRWRLRPIPGRVVEIDPRITLRPKGGMPMTVEKR